MAAENRTMKASEITCCCVVLLLVQISVSAGHRQLNSINDLKEINFGRSVPRHSLLLLYWFANAIDIDYNVIRLTFDPNRGDYGTHHYSNFEGVLNQLPWGYRYYTVGNVAKESDRTFPSYVLNPPAEYRGQNSGRIIITVQHQVTEQSGEHQIYQVFLTQHDGSNEYDPAHTYEITPNLLRQIRQFSRGNQLSTVRNIFQSRANDVQLSHIRNTWGSFACLGLFLFIVIKERNLPTYQLPSIERQCKIVENRQYDWSGGATSRDTYSGSFNSSHTHENNEGFFVCLVFLVIAFLLLCASLTPR